MNIVYFFKEDQDNNSEELRYSLRSLQNIPDTKVVIVGEKPQWVCNVLFIPVPQIRTKNENVALSLRTAINDARISDEFVLMNDDFFIMKPISVIPNLNMGTIEEVLEGYSRRYPEGTSYIEDMRMLYGALLKGGYRSPLSYELHMPMLINKSKAQCFYAELKGAPVYQFRSNYGNFCNLGGRTVKDTKIFLESRHNDSEFNKNPTQYLDKQIFLSATGGAFKKGVVGEYVKKCLSRKSQYEL